MSQVAVGVNPLQKHGHFANMVQLKRLKAGPGYSSRIIRVSEKR
jgi:hypothetical protein